MPKDINISIFGSCVSRDTFELCKESMLYRQGEENNYLVDRFVQSICPVSAVHPPLKNKISSQLIEDSASSGSVNFYKRNFSFDLTKEFLNYIAEKKSDWLIIDISCARNPLRKLKNTYISASLETEIVSKFKGIKPQSFISLDENPLVDPINLDKSFLKKCYKQYFDNIKSIYPENRIIVLDVRHGVALLNEVSNEISTFSPALENKQRRENEVISFAYDCAKEFLPQAYFVDMPPVILCNPNHKWGKMGLHYSSDIYMYYFRCIDTIINSDKQIFNAKEYVIKEQINFSKLLFDKYIAKTHNASRTENSILNLKNGCAPGKYQHFGVELTINDDYSFSLLGTAEKDITLYLYVKNKSPIGPWASVEEKTESGNYFFSSGLNEEGVQIQLVLSDEKMGQRWIKDNTKFEIGVSYSHRIIRVLIDAGAKLDAHSILTLKKI